MAGNSKKARRNRKAYARAMGPPMVEALDRVVRGGEGQDRRAADPVRALQVRQLPGEVRAGRSDEHHHRRLRQDRGKAGLVADPALRALKLIADPQADGSLVVTKPAGWTMPWGEPPVVDDDEDPRTLAMDAWRAPCTRCRSLVRLKDAWCRYDNDHDDSWRARGWPTQHTGPCCWSCMPHEPERYGWDWAMGSWGKGRATFSGERRAGLDLLGVGASCEVRVLFPDAAAGVCYDTVDSL
eukprot:CAMPEP_0206281594 /NCGR_PEP_ID=MMETSP0047_2-20121206/39210_1 /ASSEMBLY_ACC=CAM_ASM_000192 /TAXON_ID=195065 /ORGANISM="Chroomonas mesostigmatica_cf, Strain CCMP1168" /LENGTH=239 /DNA_ID=CAMNT_0053711763 /DNA_START=79 /DNA_END=799 /DNA_ORIENTATION=+